jgi:hypothetical protein
MSNEQATRDCRGDAPRDEGDVGRPGDARLEAELARVKDPEAQG